MALRSLDIERIGAPKTKRAERLQLVLRTAFELAGAAIKELRKLKAKLKRRFFGRDGRSDERTEADRRTDLIVRRLEAIVAELLDIVCNAHHPFKSQCKALLQTIIEAEPRFAAHVHARINDQFRRMRPSLEPNERLRLFPHSHREPTTRAGEPPAAPVTDALQTTIVVDLNDRAVLERLMGGPVDVSVRDPDGNVVASGRSLGFAPIVAPSTEFEAENAPQHGRIHGPMTTFSSSSSRSKEPTVKPDAPDGAKRTRRRADGRGRSAGAKRSRRSPPTDETTGPTRSSRR
ncbi:hypothetical protein M3Y99_01818300 [Aphelenchoides fujianensis]|nr:hypothetical protein M3Y99_01818300 [Aphelenchoides fujianensis]